MQSDISRSALELFYSIFLRHHAMVLSEDMSQFLKMYQKLQRMMYIFFLSTMKSIINTFQHFIFMAMIK